MGSITSALLNASGAMDAMEKAMGVIQNNVVNAGTPGYVSQTLTLKASSFDPAQQLWGGVEAGTVLNSRSQYAEANVWNQNSALGSATQQASSLSALQNIFSISGDGGIPAALSSLYSAFSAWSNNPSDTTAQQQVLSAAQGAAQAFNQAATGTQQLEQQTDTQIQTSVAQINNLSAQIATYNGEIRTGGATDGGLQAQVYSTLESLSGLANVQVHQESDGTFTVLLDGQSPLVIGTTAQPLAVQYPSAPNSAYPGAAPSAHIVATDGSDITQQVTAGQLGGLLQFRNGDIPSVLGDESQQGSLNQLAQTIADRVNQLLQSGQTSSGASGTPLFSYSAGSPTNVAGSLALAANIIGTQLAPVDPGPPAAANGIAAKLAGLSSPTAAADMINGESYTEFYAGIATHIGSSAASASAAQSTSSDLLAQAQNLRAQVSGVSLNDQAALLTQYQRCYEAAASMIQAINTTTQYLMNSVTNL
jgi:flagellar hook-associated protein 1 FlgK